MPLVLADAGTPLIWGGMFQLAFGNFLIGLFEAWLLVRYFACTWKRAGSVMVLANYFSCLGGVGLAWLWGGRIVGDTVTSFSRAILLPWVLSWLGTLVLEWPFVFAALGARPDRVRVSLRANLVVQTASYLGLSLFCLGASDLSLYRSAHMHSDTSFVVLDPRASAQAARWRVYAVDPSDGLLKSIRLDGNDLRTERREPVPSTPKGRPPVLVLSSAADGTWAIGVSGTAGAMTLLGTGVLRDTCACPPPGDRGSHYGRAPWDTVDLRPLDQRSLKVQSHPWGRLTVEEGSSYRWLNLDTISRRMEVERVITLPGDLAVVDSWDEVLLLDARTLDLGHLMRGRSPVVLPDVPFKRD